MIAPNEGPAAMIAAPADKGEARIDAIGAAKPQVVGRPEPWQTRTLVMLQNRIREAQSDFAAAIQSFAPEGCSLVNGEWVKNGE